MQSNGRNTADVDAVTYEELTAIANSVFGEGRWSHSITSQTVDFVEYVMGKYQIGCAAFVRVQLADGTFHEDMGYSTNESVIKGSAIKSARSLSIAKALRRALLCFGGIIEEKIKEREPRAERRRQDEGRSHDERNGERVGRMQRSAQDNTSRESKAKENVIPCVEESAKRVPSGNKNCSTPTRDKSPRPLDDFDSKEIPPIEPEIVHTDSEALDSDRNVNNKNSSALTVSEEEEIRLERKRKQKQKQEEYKKLMKEKLLRGDERPNPRF